MRVIGRGGRGGRGGRLPALRDVPQETRLQFVLKSDEDEEDALLMMSSRFRSTGSSDRELAADWPTAWGTCPLSAAHRPDVGCLPVHLV